MKQMRFGSGQPCSHAWRVQLPTQPSELHRSPGKLQDTLGLKGYTTEEEVGWPATPTGQTGMAHKGQGQMVPTLIHHVFNHFGDKLFMFVAIYKAFKYIMNVMVFQG